MRPSWDIEDNYSTFSTGSVTLNETGKAKPRKKHPIGFDPTPPPAPKAKPRSAPRRKKKV